LAGREIFVRDFAAQTRRAGIHGGATEAAVGEVTVIKKWKRLLLSGCECESEIAILVNLCRGGDRCVIVIRDFAER
jgi:hypothetical protein